MTSDRINNCDRVRRACAYEQGSSAGGIAPQCWTSTWHRARPGSSNNVTREYAWGLNMGGGIGGLLNVKQSGQNYSYLYDGKGNVTAVIDSAEATAVTYTYDAFGNLMVKTGSLDQPFQFSTKRYDAQTGLVYYGYRFYSPVQGRWVTRDPLGENGGINLYGLVGGNPVNWVDPLGLFWFGFPSREEHINRNRHNTCPKKEPKGCGWYKQDFWGNKYRAPDGSECVYDANGNLLPDKNGNYTYNFYQYWPPWYLPLHVWSDYVPHYYYGGGASYTPNLTQQK